MNAINVNTMSKKIIQILSALLFIAVAATGQASVESTTYILTDHLGSPILATDENGEVKWREDYQPFGTQIINEDGNNAAGFTGHLDDKTLNVTYMQGRWYHPEMGRFMAIDPVGFVEENPGSFNRYAYVNNNPYKFTDPDGEYLSYAELSDPAGMDHLSESGGRGSYVGAGGVYDLSAQIYVMQSSMQSVTKFMPGNRIGVSPVPAARGLNNVTVTKGLAGLSRSQMKTVLQSAQAAKKGSTVIGHALSKHAGRNPEIWGKITGSMKTWNDQAMKHFREIVRGPGDFKKTTSNGRDFLEKRLDDGRGVRLNMDHTFKTFID